MKISKLSFSNYKSFAGVTTLDGLQDINMVYGLNNAGKSNILKFIDLIFSPKIRFGSDVEVNGDRTRIPSSLGPFWEGILIDAKNIFHNNSANEITFSVEILTDISELTKSNYPYAKEFQKSLSASRPSFRLTLTGKLSRVGEQATIELSEVFVNDKKIFGENKIYFEGFYVGSPAKNVPSTLLNNKVAFDGLLFCFDRSVLFLGHNRFFGAEIETNASLELTPDNYKNWIHNLSLDHSRHKYYIALVDFLADKVNTCIPLPKLGIGFSREQNNIELMISSNHLRLPINDLGTGVQQILFILSAIFEKKAKIFLLEEIELNLSAKTQRILLELLQNMVSKNIIDQVIFVTHSPCFDDKRLIKNTHLKKFLVKNNTGLSTVHSRADELKEISTFIWI
jgi:hypothetical protein